jgi:hypothetical protein
MVEYMQLWETRLIVELQPGEQDTHFWRFTKNKQYSVKVAHEGLFSGSVWFEHYERVWKTWALAKCRYFLWLVAQQKSWTADRVARHGLC